jgi:acetyl-CoA C-acetyltransferase/acetyl-CoA acyltransferase
MLLGLQSIALAARAIMYDGVPCAVAGGLESISLVQNDHRNKFRALDDVLLAQKPEMYMPMIDTGRDCGGALRHRPRGAGRLRA